MRIYMTLRLLSLLIISGSTLAQVSPHVITFFVRPLPSEPSPAIVKFIEEQKKFMGPETKLPPIMSNLINLPFMQAGVYASYAGTITHSDRNGQIVFLRKSPDAALNLLVTDSIKPIPVDPLHPKTLFGFEVGQEAAAQMYLFERLQDPETEQYAWHVKPVPFDKEKRIPYDTIIVYANPHHVIVPLGPSATKKSENFVLPDFYVTERYNSAYNALRFLKVRHYFAPVAFNYSYLPSEFQRNIKT